MSVRRYFRALLLTGVLLCAEGCMAVTFRSAELKDLARRLAINTSAMSDGYNPIVVGGRPAYVLLSDGRVENIGYDLFAPALRQAKGQQVLTSFLERYFLLLNYPPADHTVRHMLRDDRFRFDHGSLETVVTLRYEDGFGYSTDDKRYVATWTRNGVELLTVSFPMEYQLLMGVTKLEAENDFEHELTRYFPAEPSLTPPDVATLKPAPQPFYYTKEAGWYLKKGINADTYYCQKSGQRYLLVNDVSHPAESAANMMLSEDTAGDYQMEMTQTLYGFKNKQFSVPLRQWLAMCRETGCRLYFGVESVDYDAVRASVFAVNEQEYYNHVLFVTIPLNVIDNRSGTIKARIHTYVPMHNALMLTRDHKKQRIRNKKVYVK